MGTADNRTAMQHKINEWLISYAGIIASEAKVNDLAAAHNAENNIRELLNELWGMKLKNANAVKSNAAGFDLIDTAAKRCIQITVEDTKDKVQRSLEKSGKVLAAELNRGEDWHFQIFILKQTAEARQKCIDGDDPTKKKTQALERYGLTFDPVTDVLDFTWMYQQVDGLEMSAEDENDKLTRFYKLCKKLFKDAPSTPFDITTCSEEELRVLRNLAILPGIWLPGEVQDWIGCEDDNVFQNLVNTGWLTQRNSEYSMHPIVKETLLLDKDEFPESIGSEFVACLENKTVFEERGKETYQSIDPKLAAAEAVLDWLPIREHSGPTYAHACHNLAQRFYDFAQYAKAEDFYQRAIQFNESENPESADLAASYNDLSTIYWAMGRLENALDFARKALDIWEKVLGPEHPNLAASYNNISTIYQDMGQLDNALEFAHKALDIREKVLGPEHPDLAKSYNNISTIYQDMGQLDKALDFARKALDIKEKVLGPAHSDLATSYNNISTVYYSMGQFDKALEFNEKALTIAQKVLGPNHPDTQLYTENRNFLLAHIQENK